MIPKDEFRRYATKHLGMSGMHLDRYAQSAGSKYQDLQGFTPNVIEERSMNIVGLDVFSRLMMDRIIFLGLAIDEYVANVIQAQLLFLESTDPRRDVQLFLNSPGGSVIAGLGIYDTMQYIAPDVSTICTGMAASMGAVLLAAGSPGKRSGLPHSRVMIHQPLGGMQGQVSDMEIYYTLVKEQQKALYDILSKHTGKPYDVIEKDCDRDNWMTARDAMSYGLLDEVLDKSNKKKEA